MRCTRAFLWFGGVVAAALLSGCVGKYKSDFSVVVVNKTVNAIMVFADGRELGEVAPGQQATFTIRLTETNPNEFTNGVAPTPQGQVTFSARDVRTGALSSPQTMTLSQSSPTYVTFTPSDFPAAGPTTATFTFSPASPGIGQAVTFDASGSRASNGTFRWSFGDGGTETGVRVAHAFAREGTFTVSLTVTSDNGQSATATRAVTVSSTLPRTSVAFTFSPAVPGVNQDVYFNASISTATGTFSWDFGDGSTAAGVTVTHRFVRAGTYTVTLTVRNAAGQSASTAQRVPVSATSPGVAASFSFSPTNPGINQEIFFNASASRPADGTFTWSFGDGSTDTGVTTSHRYASPGNYAVTLTVANDIGQSATTTRTVNVAATSAQVFASFVFSPTNPGVSQTVFFDAAASRPSTGTFTWDFGDGSTGSGVTTTHAFDRAGTYTVLLIVRNEFQQSATTSRTITVSATSPQVVASFTFSPTNPGINQEVFFNASASRPPNGTYTWSFGDGTSGTGITPTHRFAQPGTYTVTLTVTSSGQSSTTTRTITVSATSTQIVASFTFSPTNPAVNQQVFFNASASRPTDATLTWDFGDGSRGTGVAPVHQFPRAGTFTVLLTVTNENGQFATTTRTLTVSATSPQVTASFTFSPTTPGVNQEIFFDAAGSTPSNATFNWNFGDGTTGAGRTTTKRYLQAGTYTVVLTVTNDVQQSASTSRTITVSATSSSVVATFTFSPTSPSINQDVFFNSAGSTPSDGSFAWSFGDGTSGAGPAPTKQYKQAGTFTVTLTVSNAAGQSNTASRTITVSATSGMASFSFSPTNPSVGTRVFFNASASSAPSGIAAYEWDFGDGCKPGSEGGSECEPGSTNGVVTNHAFQRAGTYVVRLTIRDNAGNTATTTSNVTVSQ